MGRIRRPNLPGRAFHLTARIQNREHRFIPRLRSQIVRLLRRNVARSDAQLLAYVIMSNHLHLVVIQGDQPLSDLMQPFLRSVALATHALFGTEGHVFERRFSDRVCRDPDHLRNAIAYTHANPVRAGMCEEPGDYVWSSYRRYLGLRPVIPSPRVEAMAGLRAFSTTGSPRTGIVRHSDLVEFAGRDVHPTPETGGAGEILHRPTGPGSTPHVLSLDDVAARILTAQSAPLSVAPFRSRWGSRSRLAIRDRIAMEASRAGHSGGAIAEFLGVSAATVSRILAASRQLDSPGP
jgi:putative transposase